MISSLNLGYVLTLLLPRTKCCFFTPVYSRPLLLHHVIIKLKILAGIWIIFCTVSKMACYVVEVLVFSVWIQLVYSQYSPYGPPPPPPWHTRHVSYMYPTYYYRYPEYCSCCTITNTYCHGYYWNVMTQCWRGEFVPEHLLFAHCHKFVK